MLLRERIGARVKQLGVVLRRGNSLLLLTLLLLPVGSSIVSGPETRGLLRVLELLLLRWWRLLLQRWLLVWMLRVLLLVLLVERELLLLLLLEALHVLVMKQLARIRPLLQLLLLLLGWRMVLLRWRVVLRVRQRVVSVDNRFRHQPPSLQVAAAEQLATFNGCRLLVGQSDATAAVAPVDTATATSAVSTGVGVEGAQLVLVLMVLLVLRLAEACHAVAQRRQQRHRMLLRLLQRTRRWDVLSESRVLLVLLQRRGLLRSERRVERRGLEAERRVSGGRGMQGLSLLWLPLLLHL
jgi:hypothetical protein